MSATAPRITLLTRLAHGVMLSDGWRRRAIAFAAGATGALALAPVDLFPLMIAPMTIAVWLIDGAAEGGGAASLRSAAAAGWFWGFGYFLAGLWWLGAAFLVEPDKFAWAMPLGVVVLPAGLALFPALGFALARLLWSSGPARVLALTAGLGLAEWLRGNVLTGFPWNNFGMALGDQPWLMQGAAIGGLYGLTLLTIALAAAPATLTDGREGRLSPRPTLVALAVLIGLAIFGALRLTAPPTGDVAGVRLRLMQPNLPQDAKFRPQNKAAILKRYLTLSDRATGPRTSGVADATHLIWPESAFPFILSRDAAALAEIGAFLPGQTRLITGAARVAEGQGPNGRDEYFNAIQVIGHGGRILDSYDKVHLVPFGEYLPLRWLLTRLGLTQFVAIPGGFEAGRVRRTLEIPGLPPAAPLICYEAIFPGEVTAPPAAGAPRPGFMLNLTNDGWFGRTSGPYQHLAQARLRAVEEGLPLVRVANTGVSAVIDPYGRILASLPLGVEDVLDSPLPKAIAPPPFVALGLWPAAILWFVALVSALFGRWRERAN